MNETTDPRVWIEIAEEDLATAELVLRRKTPLLRPACFHSQQCAEKYLKAALVAHRRTFPKTHDLYALSELCAKAGVLFEMDKDNLDLLSSHAARVRYPGRPPRNPRCERCACHRANRPKVCPYASWREMNQETNHKHQTISHHQRCVCANLSCAGKSIA
ncbi:MAG: HEPN domain-containing protein [Chloroflexi bacterium]|nr:HEPN domain-containing protein [Chloroflexota bacterium]